MRMQMRVAIAMLAVVGVIACGGGSTAPNNTNNNNGGGNPGGSDSLAASVDVQDNLFSPDSVRIKAGGTVTWTWGGTYAQHNVTFDDATVGKSTNMTSGSFERTFAAAGTYQYRCTNHPGMTGKIVVQ